MATNKEQEERSMNVRVPITLHRRVGVFCAEHDLTLKRFVTDAVESHLERLIRSNPRNPSVRIPANGSRNGEGSDEASLIRVEHVLGLTRTELGALLGVAEDRLDAPQTWSRRTHARLSQLADLADRLEDTFEPESIPEWLHSPSRDLHWQNPIDLLRDGQLDIIDAALEAIDSGVYV